MIRPRVKAGYMHVPAYNSRICTDTLKILCVLQGTMVVSDALSDIVLERDDIYIANSASPSYFYEQNDRNSCALLSVEIDLNYFRKFFPDITDGYYFTCRVKNESQVYREYLRYVRSLMARIYFLHEDRTLSHNADAEIEDLTRTLIAFLLEHFQHYIYEEDENGDLRILLDTEQRTPYDPERIYRIIDYIYDHSAEKICLADLEKLEYLSTCHLSRYIKKVSGLSFCEHLSMARCEKAEGLLITTRKTIDEIAAETGFANRQHFSSQFRRWFKMSPSEYRKHFLVSFANTKENPHEMNRDEILLIIKSYLDL